MYTTHPLYDTWRGIWRKCYDPTHRAYKSFGARGITLSDDWQSLEGFVQDMGPKPKRARLWRRDPAGPFSAENCYWAPTTAAQGRSGPRRWDSASATAASRSGSDIELAGYAFYSHQGFTINTPLTAHHGAYDFIAEHTGHCIRVAIKKLSHSPEGWSLRSSEAALENIDVLLCWSPDTRDFLEVTPPALRPLGKGVFLIQF